MKKEPIAIDVVKKWLKTFCKKGDKLEILSSQTSIILTKVNPIYVETWSYSKIRGKKKLKNRTKPN